jgi:hypothetical protein
LDGIPFTFDCTVHWKSARPQFDDNHADPAAVAVAAVLQRARQVCHSHNPDDDTVVHALAASLGHSAPTHDGLLFAWATGVAARVGQEHREHLYDLATLRRQQNLQQQRIANQRMLRTYLGDEVLTSVGSAVVWWLARDETQVRETVELIGTLAQLSAAATDSEVDELFQHLVPDHLREPAEASSGWFSPSTVGTSTPSFVVDGAGDVEPTAGQPLGQADLLPDADDAGNSLFGHQFADLAARHGHDDLAQQIRERYQTIDTVDQARETAPPDGRVDFFEDEQSTTDSATGAGEVPPPPEPPEEPDVTRDWGAGG